jgi:CheY-like chemotaxis protein
VRGGVKAADLARQMLAYSGRAKIAISRLDFSQTVEELAELLRVSIPKNCQMEFSLVEGLPAVEGDSAQLSQVVMNLILNAADAVGESYGSVSVTTELKAFEQAQLGEEFGAPPLASGEYVSLTVTDTGVGMDEALVDRIFDPYFSTKSTGHGLGLSATLGIVRAHHGAIRCESVPGKGTTFEVILPAAGGPLSQRDAPTLVPSLSPNGAILVVDDETSVRGLLAQIVEQLGFGVLTASDGLEALAVYREHQDEIVLTLLDLTMPRMSGTETLSELRQFDPSARVILMSGYNQDLNGDAFTQEDLAACLHKPFRYEQLRNVIAQILKAPLED